MKKSVVLILVFNICLGIVAPTIVALNDHSLEEAVVLVNIEKDIEILMVGIQSQPKYLMKMIGIIGELIPEERIFDRFADCREFIIDEQAKITA